MRYSHGPKQAQSLAFQSPFHQPVLLLCTPLSASGWQNGLSKPP
jgi:hypothetical protein